MINLQTLRTNLEQQKGKRDRIAESISQTKQVVKDKGRDLRRHEQAREIIREVGLKTQQILQFHISDITSLALEAVFDDPYELIAEFIERRNKTECDLLFERDGARHDPLSASGGGAVDVASFALRVASWSMQRPRSRAVLILDEPFRFLSTGLLPRASEMLKQVSSELGLQIIMVTHSETLTDCADKVFQVGIKRGRSEVKDV